MKIAIVLLNRGRGSGVVAKEHAVSLMNLGHEVFYMHPGMGDGVSGAKNIDIVLPQEVLPVHEYLPSAKNTQKAVSHMSFEEAMDYIPTYEAALEDIIEDIDIVIGHHANLVALATSNVCKRHGKPYVLFLHGTGIEPRHHGFYNDDLWSLIEKAIQEADGILVTTEYVREELVRNMVELPVDKILVHACGVNIKEFNKSNTGNIKEKYNLNKPYVICPGALTESKGPQNVVEASKAYAELAETIFIGDGELRSTLEEDLGQRGRFLGFVSNEDKAQLINAATLLVAAPEKKEHFGIIYTEAMAGGVPIVAYEGGGVNSIVTPETGILTERNPSILGESVLTLLKDSKLRNQMAENCEKRAEEFYAAKVLGPKLNQWLMKIIDGQRV